MKIIDIAMCVDNIDPEHLGRIRVNRYSTQTGVIEGAYNIEAKDKWSSKDLFVAGPFLPVNSNFIPEIGQSVKLINYNTDKPHVNMEYIAGPFTTMYDFNGQTHLAQIEKTSYGGPVKRTSSITDKLGNFLHTKSKGSFAKHNHYGIYGKYGSDVIFTDDGLMLRGGKFLSKIGASTKDRKKMSKQPIMSNKSANIYLKKFPKTKYWDEAFVEVNTQTVSDLKFLIEYEVTNFATVDGVFDSGTINFYIYKLKPDPQKEYKTDNSFLKSVSLKSGYYELVTNIPPHSGTDTSSTDPNISIMLPLVGLTPIEASINARNVIKKLHTDGITQNSLTYSPTDGKSILNNFSYTGPIHPFFYRVTNSMVQPITDSSQNVNRYSFLDKIDVYGKKESGLIYSKTKIDAEPDSKKVIKPVLKEKEGEQTFGTVKADQIFLLSTSPTHSTGDDIDFGKLDKYEITQEDYIMKIWPNTYSTVRGETLYEVLVSMFNLFVTHKHDILEPLEQSDPSFQALKKKIESLEQDMLNGSIRIN